MRTSEVTQRPVVTLGGEDVAQIKDHVADPLPDTVAASGEHLVVPASAADFVGDDLAGFGAAVDAFRAQLGGRA